MPTQGDLIPPEPAGQPPAVVPQNPMEILGAAVSQGIDPAGLATLSELAKEWEDRSARKEFADCLMRFQDECPEIVKSKKVEVVTKAGGRYSFAYAPLDRIERIAKPILRRLGFSYSWDSRAENGIMEVTCTLRHVNGHSESASFACPTDSPNPKMTGQQKYAGANTFARRITLTSVLGLASTEDDPDGMMDGAERVPVETITEQQAVDLEAYADSVNADKPRFLKWLGVSRFDDIPKASHEQALKALAKKGEQG